MVITIEELKKGDILLFSPEKTSIFSQLIAIFSDNSKVSHSAMYYGESKIIEEVSPKITINEIKERCKDRTVYVKRFQGTKNLEPVMFQAGKYFKEEIPYSQASLYILGVLLFYNKIAHRSLKKSLLIKLFKAISYELFKEIMKHKSEDMPMVCSQFIANCYDNAVSKSTPKVDYTLKIENSVLSGLKSIKLDSLNLVEKVINRFETKNLSSINLLEFTDQEKELNIEEICKEIYEDLEDKIEDNRLIVNKLDKLKASDLDDADEEELVKAATDFYQVHLYLNGSNNIESILKLHKNGKYYNMFVLPEDLLNNCTNLEDKGIIKI